jgi:predicted RNase H-like nuclease (RuvC/YqgF family)
MALYRIEMMTRSSYHNMMTGSNNYSVRKVDIEADTPNKAIEIAKANAPGMIINEEYIKTVVELEEKEAKRRAEIEAYRKAEEEKKLKAKARKEAREAEKAAELGLTITEYKVKLKHDKKVREVEKRITALKEELAEAEKYLQKLQKTY